MYRAHYFSPILTKFGLPKQMFVEVPDIKFHKIPSSGSRAAINSDTKISSSTTLLLILLLFSRYHVYKG
jgi:hypothetical protein